MRASRWSAILATWVSVLAALFGGYIGLSTYTEEAKKRVDERQKQTFNLVELFMSEHFMPIRHKALAAVRRAQSCEPASAAGTNEQLSDSEYFAFVEFFEVVDLCVESDLCDRKLVEAFFVPYANGHWPFFEAPIKSTREAEDLLGFKQERPFGTGLEHLALVKLKAPQCPSR